MKKELPKADEGKRHWRSADNCRHYSWSVDGITGEHWCDDCGALLIDSIGRVYDQATLLAPDKE